MKPALTLGRLRHLSSGFSRGPVKEEAGPLGTGRLRASGEEVLL